MHISLIEHGPTAVARGLDPLLSTPLTASDPHTDTVHVKKRILRTTTYSTAPRKDSFQQRDILFILFKDILRSLIKKIYALIRQYNHPSD